MWRATWSFPSIVRFAVRQAWWRVRPALMLSSRLNLPNVSFAANPSRALRILRRRLFFSVRCTTARRVISFCASSTTDIRLWGGKWGAPWRGICEGPRESCSLPCPCTGGANDRITKPAHWLVGFPMYGESRPKKGLSGSRMWSPRRDSALPPAGPCPRARSSGGVCP